MGSWDSTVLISHLATDHMDESGKGSAAWWAGRHLHKVGGPFALWPTAFRTGEVL